MITVHHGDCLDILPTLPDNSVDSIVTDPPYHLVQASRNGSNQPGDLSTPHGRSGPSNARSGFMGKTWDGGDIAFRPDVWRECMRVLKPGGHMCAFGGARTFHRLVCAVEDAGFEIRDTLMWLYGSGFAKSFNLRRAPICECESLSIDAPGSLDDGALHGCGACPRCGKLKKEYVGFGSALKPAHEPIVLARKPLAEANIAENVLKYGTGALNIDASRVPAEMHNHPDGVIGFEESRKRKGAYELGSGRVYVATGRWPANLLHDGSDEVLELFPQSKSTGGPYNTRRGPSTGATFGGCNGGFNMTPGMYNGYTDDGSAARFFTMIPQEHRALYCAKASKKDRAASMHPTVKPQRLLNWLIRLITPPGGVVLDPFAGSGSTASAALTDGYSAVLIEQDQTYYQDICKRLNLDSFGTASELNTA